MIDEFAYDLALSTALHVIDTMENHPGLSRQQRLARTTYDILQTLRRVLEYDRRDDAAVKPHHDAHVTISRGTQSLPAIDLFIEE